MVTASYGLDLGTDSPMDDNGNYLRTPTASEFAKTQNIQVNDTIESTKKIGEIGTLSELNKDDDDESTGGSGNFLWSFG